MADIIKTATRDAYGKALVELGGINDKIVVLDADLAAATKTGMFKKAYPDRFFDCGIVRTIPVISPIISPIIVPARAISIVKPTP